MWLRFRALAQLKVNSLHLDVRPGRSCHEATSLRLCSSVRSDVICQQGLCHACLDFDPCWLSLLIKIVLFQGLRLTAGRRPTWVCGAYVTPMLALVGPILSKVKLSGAHLGPRLGQVGPMWCMLGTSWAHVEPMLAYVRPMLAWVGPMLGLCWRLLAPSWPMLALC